ncbi:MAG TPA: hypothetical protein VFF07_16200 [Actinomycetota bacterium]|nr:hypothetical protein [Actinomycetota bacterium]
MNRRRSWRSRALELLLWVALSVVTAVVMVSLSERLLPSNF